LFLRAVVAEQEVIVLDEPFQFMSAESMARCAEYLEELGGKAAVVWIGHWEGERPWGEGEGMCSYFSLVRSGEAFVQEKRERWLMQV
jgi:ABC-type molybdenum transport system ATPase subunit/photorepair protein PhrA